MLRALLDRLTYANVVATLALFLALGTGLCRLQDQRLGHQEAQPDG
ncbi:MAG: hypothetical protein QOF13_884 [Solirubrobacterales bacterium]|jgi:hypothetical protein|nr:hypothetical protein [Solirubrobacterales bacterium]